MTLQFYNSLTRQKEPLTPVNQGKVGMYVCGPTVYARPHIGNARSVVVYDVLFRLLRHVYGESHVTYVRNITDVDDKINAAAIERGITIQALTAEVTQHFHDDMAALNCLRPSIEPRATEHIDGMITMIQTLKNHGNAYVGSDGQHVLFDVTSQSEHPAWRYGMLSGRAVEDQQAGARVAVESYKKHPGDFVLWKPADDEDDASSVFDSPWGKGRPGWHIECSVMSTEYLGHSFDIHGGGADLKFPHHENEIAQSCCAHPHGAFAKLWVHNGFLTVNGEKMSKSLGNFITVKDLLDKGIKGEVIRLALLSAKYNEPLDWNDKVVSDASKLLDKMYRMLERIPHPNPLPEGEGTRMNPLPMGEDGEARERKQVRGMDALFAALSDDLNFPKAMSVLQQLPDAEKIAAMRFLGLLQHNPDEWFRGVVTIQPASTTHALSSSEASIQESLNLGFSVTLSVTNPEIEKQIALRTEAKKARDFATSDRIRDELKAQGIILEDRPDGTTDWRRG